VNLSLKYKSYKHILDRTLLEWYGSKLLGNPRITTLSGLLSVLYW